MTGVEIAVRVVLSDADGDSQESEISVRGNFDLHKISGKYRGGVAIKIYGQICI